MNESPFEWDLASNDYLQQIGPRLTRDYAGDLIERMNLSPECSVLEVAAGTGELTIEMAVRAKTILATDISDEMLGALQGRLQKRRINNVLTSKMSGELLDCASSSFDRAVCMFGIMLFEAPIKGLQELRRVLRPTGRAVISVWSTPDHFEMMQLFASAVAGLCPDQKPLDLTKNPAFTLSDSAKLKTLMKEAGFSNICIDTVSHLKNFASVDELWSILISATPPLFWFLEGIGIEDHNELKRRLHDQCLSKFVRFPLQLSSEALIISADP